MCGRYYSLFDKQQIAEHFHLRSTADNVGIIAATGIQIPKSKLTETCLYVPRIEHILVTMGTMARTPTPIPFTPPMECLPVARIPEGDTWIYELKLDGYRAQAIRDIKGVRLL